MSYSLEDYVADGKMSRKQYEAICGQIEQKKNILIGGKKQSGKTTLVNAIVQKMVELDADRPLVLVGKIRELKCGGNRYVKAMLAASEVPNMIASTARKKENTLVLDNLHTAAAASQMLCVWKSGFIPTVTSLTTVSGGGTQAVTDRLLDYLSMSGHKPKSILSGEQRPAWMGLIVHISKYKQKIEMLGEGCADENRKEKEE